MKILVITSRYNLTGVALAQARFARALAERGHAVDLVFGAVDEDQLAEDRRALPVVPGALVSAWGVRQARGMLGPLRRYLREHQPDIVFSAEDHLNDMVLLAALLSGSRAKISGSSRVLPVDALGHDGPYSNTPLTKKWVFKQVTRALMRRADALTCVSEDMLAEYKKLFPRGPHQCVYNIVVDDRSRERMREPVDLPWFAPGALPVVTSAGTLTQRKGWADLLRAIGHLRDDGRIVRLALLGEGPTRAELEALARELGIAEQLWMPGRIDNPLSFFARSPVSSLSSYSEGLPNVLIEAMMCGCTPVATDCPTGPREVLQGGRYGYLVPMHAPRALADGIAAALDRPIAPDLLAEAIRPFHADAVIARHFELLGVSQA